MNESIREAVPVVDRLSDLAPVEQPPIAENTAVVDSTALGIAWLLWAQRRLLWRWLLCGLTASILLAFLLPRRYDAVTRLMPPDTSNSSGMAMVAALAGNSDLLSSAGDFLGVKNSGALFIAVLRSDRVEDRIIDRFSLKKEYWVRRQADARRKLQDWTEITEERKSGVITIKVRDSDARRAADIARAYVEELDRAVAELNTSAAHRERVFIEERLAVVKEELDQAAKQFSEFSSKNTAIDLNAQTRAMVDAAAALQGQMIAAESELKGLEQIYTSNNVRVRALRSRIQELQDQLQKLGGSSGDTQAGSSPDALYPSIRKIPLLGVTYFDLYRRLKIKEGVYDTLTKRYELAKIDEAKQIPSVRVLDRAEVPERKAFPPRLGIAVVGSLLSLLAAATWILGNSLWQHLDPEDPRKLFFCTVAAAVGARWKSAKDWIRRSDGLAWHRS